VNVKKGSIPFLQFISSYLEEILGKVASGKFLRNIPFLLKVLSVGEALSKQAHPNKQKAEQLHLRDPEHYPDENRKSEITIILNSLTVLDGFNNFIELFEVFQKCPELALLLEKIKSRNLIYFELFSRIKFIKIS